MSARGVGALLCGLGGGLILGAVGVWGEATSSAQIKAKNTFDEQLELHKRLVQRQAEAFIQEHLNPVEPPVAAEADLEADKILTGVEWDGDTEIKVGGELIAESDIAPDYLAQANQYADPSTYTRPELDVSISYIEEEEYEDDDGRAKEQVTIMMGGGGDDPLFFMDGMQIDNWGELIGDQILVDFYKMVPPGADRVLYLRNHKLDTDFEVLQESP